MSDLAQPVDTKVAQKRKRKKEQCRARERATRRKKKQKIAHFGKEEEVKIANYDKTGRTVLMLPFSTEPTGKGKRL